MPRRRRGARLARSALARRRRSRHPDAGRRRLRGDSAADATAYDQFAIRAFEAQALDYLVKPVAEARFAATMKRLTRQLRAFAESRALGFGDASRLTAPATREPTIVVSTARGATVVPLREIDWIEAADNYARIW